MASGAKLPKSGLNLFEGSDVQSKADMNNLVNAIETNATNIGLLDITEWKNNSRVRKSNGFIVAYQIISKGTVIPAAYGGTNVPFPYTFTATPFVAMSESGNIQNPDSFDINTDLAVSVNPTRDGWQLRARGSDMTLVNDIVLFVAGFETY